MVDSANNTQVRIPLPLWRAAQKKADSLGLSGIQFVNQCVEDCIAQIDAKTPAVPRIVDLVRLAAKKK